MSRDQIKYDEVSQALSGARLGTYLRYSKNDVAGAFQLHHVNAQLAASFWEPLELFEVVLRNLQVVKRSLKAQKRSRHFS